MSVLSYLMERTGMGPTERCWSSPLSKGSHGYTQAWDGRTVRLMHVMWWEALHGPVPNRGRGPEQNTLDHVCHNRECVNPYHLRVLTNRENARDNGFATRTHCPQGHAYTEVNTRTNGKGWRWCRACQTRSNSQR